ncbi:MAG: SIMPL domain-containing protein [Selenomonadaceae bacterium]|nr:SIMPL domain-containing protein [Selenomonadaceae bacterium]
MKTSQKASQNLVLFLLACAISLLLPSVSQASGMEPPLLSVNGQGMAQAAPDEAVVTISVTNHASDAKTAQQVNVSKASAIQNAIKGLGIEDKDIQTRNYSFYPTYSSEKGHENEINGYQASNSILVTIHDLGLVGQVIDTALGHGANQISSLDFRIRNTEKLRKEALTSAIRDARNKADIIAQGLGKRIVGIKTVSEDTGNIGHRTYSMAMLAKSNTMEDSTPIEAGTLTLNASVHIDYILDN